MLARHKSSIAVDLKSAAGVALVRELSRTADVLIDPFRPGVLERLGLGPDVLCAANPRLVYGRMTGFRRDGRYRDMAGHDINYLAVGGVLALLGRKGQKPTPPWNMLADFAGGGAALFQGVLLALLARGAGGRGQVVEANMVDGAAYLATFPRFALKTPLADRPRGENVLDSGCPWYDTYETADGRYMAVGAIEPQFYALLVKGLGMEGQGWEERRQDRQCWPEMRDEFSRRFRGRTRREWEAVFDGTDACCTPVLDYRELEGSKAYEGDQRPSVTLRDTPWLAVHQGATDVSQGQGPGVDGNGYEGTLLGAGAGGEEVLRQWLGWARGREFDVDSGGLVLKDKSKL
jgi:alpha-methylacyl-CoA racemase